MKKELSREERVAELVRREELRLESKENERMAKRAEAVHRSHRHGGRVPVWCEAEAKLFPSLKSAARFYKCSTRHVLRAVTTKGGRRVKGRILCRPGDVPIP